MTTYNIINDTSLDTTDVKTKDNLTITAIASDNPKEPMQLNVSTTVIKAMESIVLSDTAFNKKLDTLNKGTFALADTCKLGVFISEMQDAVKDATGLDVSNKGDTTKINAIMQAISPKFKALCTGDNKAELTRRRADAKTLANTIPENLEIINGVRFIDFNAMVGTNDISNLKPKTLVQKISKNKTAKDKKTKDAELDTPISALTLITDMLAEAKKHKITEHAIALELQSFMVQYQSELHAKEMSDLQAKNKDLLEQQAVVNTRLATANAKNLNADRKKAEAPKIAEVNDKLEAIALEKKNRNMAMFGISA